MSIFVGQLQVQGPKKLSGTMPVVCNDLTRDQASVHISEQMSMITKPVFKPVSTINRTTAKCPTPLEQ